MFEDAKEVIRSRKSKMDKQHSDQTRKDKQHSGQTRKDKQHSGQTRKDRVKNNDIQNTTYKTNDWGTQTQLKSGVNSGAPEGWAVPATHVTPVVLLLLHTR